ncbi:type II secretion system F family protein [Nitrincola tapanii]|uniref:Type II secretion system F family protein n=1 Tax=Nitrincola tapanii TaxID=1708751 RepID=A0A5A9W0T9_9GAMM|nr:type II secretion system F family protein [Nitrincola tapanii]KAA0874390.1 type II secretion system F family protein [Nitrincola tapanii]
MAKFNYTALDQDTKSVSGQLEANSRRQALRELHARNLVPLTLLEGQAEELESGDRHTKRLSERDTLTALYELASMLVAGVSAAEAVESQALSAAHPQLRRAFKQMLKTLRHGGNFSSGLESAELKLPEYVVSLVKAGEMTGNLGEALADACEQMEYALRMRAEARNALIYPAILVLTGILAVVMMFVYVVPSFTNLLDQSNELPWLAWAVLSAGRWANDHWIVLIGLFVMFLVVPIALWRLASVRLSVMTLLEKVPVVGSWLIQADIAAWAAIMASMMRNRVELMTALHLAASVVRLPGRRQRLLNAAKAVKQGEHLSIALEQQHCLNETGYNLVRVGEKTGALDKMLQSLSELYTRQGQQRMKKALALIEPIAILAIGGAIGTLIIAIILAITSANDLAF